LLFFRASATLQRRFLRREVASGKIVDGANVMVVPGADLEYPASRKQ